MRISIIIPALNESAVISACLLSLQQAREQGVEIVLADGGSVDNTRELAAPLVDRVMQGASGRATQLNLGASAASGDVLWFIHADTIVPTHALQALRAKVEGTASREFWGRFDVRIDNSGKPYRMIEYMMNLRSRLTSVATGDQGIFVSRHLFSRTGGFAALPLMEDIELSKRLRKITLPMVIAVPVSTSARRWEKSGIARTILLMWWLRLAYVCGAPVERLARWYRQVNT